MIFSSLTSGDPPSYCKLYSHQEHRRIRKEQRVSVLGDAFSLGVGGLGEGIIKETGHTAAVATTNQLNGLMNAVHFLN